MRKQISMPKMNVNTGEDFFLETSFANAENWCRTSNQDCSKLRTTYKVMNHMLRLKDLTWKPSAHAANTHWNNNSLVKPKNTPRNEKRRVTDKVSKNKERKRRRPWDNDDWNRTELIEKDFSIEDVRNKISSVDRDEIQ